MLLDACYAFMSGHMVIAIDLLQVLEVYAPESLHTPHFPRPTFPDLPQLHNSCVADVMLYATSATYICTDIFFVENSTDSLIHSDKVARHRRHGGIVRDIWNNRGNLH